MRSRADDAYVGAGPLRGPRVDLALCAVGPAHVRGDRDGVPIVNVVTLVLALPAVRRVLGGLAGHSSSSNTCSMNARRPHPCRDGRMPAQLDSPTMPIKFRLEGNSKDLGFLAREFPPSSDPHVGIDGEGYYLTSASLG